MIRLAICSFCGKHFYERDYENFEEVCAKHEIDKHTIQLSNREDYFRNAIEIFNEKYKFNPHVPNVRISSCIFNISDDFNKLYGNCTVVLDDCEFALAGSTLDIQILTKLRIDNTLKSNTTLTLEDMITELESDLVPPVMLIKTSHSLAKAPINIDVCDLMLDKIISKLN